MKKLEKIFLHFAAAVIGLSLLAPTASAQTTALKKAVEDIKDSVDLLIGAKDSDSESLAFRLETFKKVVDLAATETKDLKVKILAFESTDKKINAWKERQIKKINALLDYYADQEEVIATEKEIALEDLKKMAQEFKDHRESDFRPVAEETSEFFLIQQENRAIEIAEKRLQKISKDIEKLKSQKIKNIKKVDAYLEKSEELIEASAVSNQTAASIFWQRFNATSSPIAANETVAAENNDDATSTEESANAASKIQEPSIKDLVYASLNDLKGAYQTFIDLSNFVRELLK